MSALRSLTLTDVRRLNVVRQHLSGATKPAMLEVVRDLGCLQLDPISAVQRSHLLVLFSRLGVYDPQEINKLIYIDKALFEYWAHVASIVLTEDYPIHALRMRTYPNGSWGGQILNFLAEDARQPLSMQTHILNTLQERGATPSRFFEDKTSGGLTSSGWTSDRNVSRMLDYLWDKGKIMVARREGIQRVWDLAERCLPDWTPREELSEAEVVRRAAQKALRSLGVATEKHIQQHYIRGRYPNLKTTLKTLADEKIIERVTIQAEQGGALAGEWFLHSADIPHLEKIQQGDFTPQTTLLSPFDNLICDRNRLEQLWNFFFRVEIYTPAAKRQYGYYVLPILHGERLIGRIDPLMDRKQQRLQINAIYAESDAPTDAVAINGIRAAIERLAAFLGAATIDYPATKIPAQWQGIRA